MQIYAIRMFNFLRFGEKNNSIVFDLTDDQKDDIKKGKYTLDHIYDEFAKRPWDSIQEKKALGIEKLLGISGIIDGNDKSSNGAGKSTILDAICYAHYGKISRLISNTDKTGDAGMSVVTKINKQIPEHIKEFWVEEFFEVNNNIYRIKRGRAISKSRKTSSPILEFECIKGEHVISESGHRTTDTQKSIEDVNDMPYDLFVSSQMFAQNDAGKFLTGTDKVRKEMLISMLKMENAISSCLKEIRERKSNANKKLDAVLETISVLEKQAFALYKKHVPNTTATSYSQSIIQEMSLSVKQQIEDLKIFIYNTDKDIQVVADNINKLQGSDKINLVSKIKDEEIRAKTEHDKQKSLLDEQTKAWKDVLANNTKEIRDKESEILVLSNKIDSLNREIAVTRKKLDSFNEKECLDAISKAKKAKEVKDKYETLKTNTEKERSSIVDKISEKKAEISSITTLINKYKKQKNEFSEKGKLICAECESVVDISHINVKISDKTSACNLLEAEMQSLLLTKEKIDKSLLDVNEKVNKIFSFISNEPKAIIAKTSYENNVRLVDDMSQKINIINDDITKLKASLENLRAKKAECENKISSIQAEFDQNIHRLSSSLDDIRKKMAMASADAANINNEIRALSVKKTNLENEKNKSIEKIGFITNELESFRNNIALIESEEKNKNDYVKQLKNYECLEDIFGLDGMQTRIVRKYLPLLNVYVNEFLSILSNNNLRVEMVINQFSEVDLSVHGGTADTYGMLSGGEKMIIRLAVDIGLAILSFARSARKPEIICLDEIFGPLDDLNTSLVFRMLQHLQDKFNRILIITHKSEIKELIPNNIIVEKSGGLNAMSEIKTIE